MFIFKINCKLNKLDKKRGGGGVGIILYIY